MKIVIYAGGKQWVIDENILLAFLQANGQTMVPNNERTYDSSNTTIKDGTVLLKG